TGPSGNSRPVARTRTLAMKILPALLAAGRILASPRARNILLRLLWQTTSGLPTRRQRTAAIAPSAPPRELQANARPLFPEDPAACRGHQGRAAAKPPAGAPTPRK